MKICRTCQREYEPSSRHKDCPGCRKNAYKTPCIDCGKPSQRKYKRCEGCGGARQRGERNPNWKGGRWRRNYGGYIYIRYPEHPRAKSNSGYVFEHILVMENVLGRYLFPGENVHHLNGIRDDNRPDNLELWTKPQPAGIRVDDAVRHALEVLQRYAPECLNGSITLYSEADQDRIFENPHLHQMTDTYNGDERLRLDVEE